MAEPQSPEDRALVGRVRDAFEQSERRHKSYRDRWAHVYGLYRSHQELRRWYQHDASPRDRDTGLRDLQREWGAELFIPYSFETVETILPRMLSNRPRMLILPRGDTPEHNVRNMRLLIDWQQQQIAYEMRTQDTGKSGLVYGLGVQKTYWRKQTATRRRLVEGVRQPWVPQEYEATLFNDPDAEDVDIFDFFWDPFGKELQGASRCRYVIHRTWRDTGYCLRCFRNGTWTLPAGLKPDDVERMGAPEKYDEVIRDRLRAAGHSAVQHRDEQLHEVWEFHDGDRIITVLDRDWPVQVADNPAWHGELPFHAFRPTTQAIPELPGIGEIEAIEHLQHEMNTLRSQRRDNATLVLQRVFAFADGLVDPDDLKFGPGLAIPTNGDPRELLFPIPVGDIPASGYQEEGALKADIERVTGISDQVTGASSAQETATGAQLVQAAANVRIQNKTRRLEVETIASCAQQWVYLDQQKIVASRQVPVPQTDGRWSQVSMGPAELQGDMFVVAEGGATAPDNVPQMRQDAGMMWNLLRDHPQVEQTELLRQVLRNLGVRQPDSWLRPEQRVPPVFLNLLEQAGVEPQAIGQMLQQALAIEEQQKLQAQGGQQPSPNGVPQEAPAQ